MKFFTPLLDKVNKSVSNLLSVSNLEESYIAPSGTVNPNFKSNTSISSFSSEIVGSSSPGFDISPPDKLNKSLEIYKSFHIEPLNSTFREQMEISPSNRNSDKVEKSNFSKEISVFVNCNDENVINDKFDKSPSTNDKLNVSENKRINNVANDKFEKSNFSNAKMLKNSNQKSPQNLEKSFDKVENEYFCKSCKNEGCCQICHKIPCDKSIRCSAKSCQKWTHYNCGNTNEEEIESMRIYYCPPCKESNPLLKNIFYKNKKSKKTTQTQSEKLKRKRLKNSQKSKTTKKLEKNLQKF